MSYILEALNKSEQERRGQQSPDLNTVHRAPPAKTNSRTPWLLIIGLFAVFNLSAIGYWFFSQESSKNSVVSQDKQISQSSNTEHSAQIVRMSSQPVVQTPIERQPEPSSTIERSTIQQGLLKQETATAQPRVTIETSAATSIAQNSQSLLITPESAFSTPSQDAVRITELPINVQRQVPDLVFSSHLYSSDASFRMVNINGKMIREGDMVANDLKLLEISEEGVILGYLHYVFEVSVLSDWSFN